jgi:hypothetical protein
VSKYNARSHQQVLKHFPLAIRAIFG